MAWLKQTYWLFLKDFNTESCRQILYLTPVAYWGALSRHKDEPVVLYLQSTACGESSIYDWNWPSKAGLAPWFSICPRKDSKESLDTHELVRKCEKMQIHKQLVEEPSTGSFHWNVKGWRMNQIKECMIRSQKFQSGKLWSNSFFSVSPMSLLSQFYYSAMKSPSVLACTFRYGFPK